MTKYLFAALVAWFFTLMIFSLSPALACSCGPSPDPKVALEGATAVFAGKVIAIEEEEHEQDVKLQIKIDVSKCWKGVTSTTVIVTTRHSTAACGYPFEISKEYLVYAQSVKGQEYLQTNFCSRTQELADAKEDLAELGEGSTPPCEGSDTK